MASSKAPAIATLVLRLLTFIFLVLSVVILVRDKVTVTDSSRDTEEVDFTNVRTYKYVLATNILGIAYIIFQIPFAVYFVSTGKRMIRHDLLPEFDFFGDKIISFVLATGVGAGFAVTIELKKLLGDLLKSLAAIGDVGNAQSKLDKFLNTAHISFGFLFLGFFCMALLSVLSSRSLIPKGGSFFG